jgi:hypothetical protein
MPPRRDGVCRHCGETGWIMGRGLCRKCYSAPSIRSRYLTFRTKRRALVGATYGYCSVCGRWRYITGRDRCRSCYRHYSSSGEPTIFVDLEREARIEEYTKRAARRQPLFETAFDSERMDQESKGIDISRGINTLTYA